MIRQANKSQRNLDPLIIFLAAALMFEVESMIAKLILPWFGGSASVWITCLIFFQVMLLGGYLYAHLLIKLVRARWQLLIQAGLLLVSLAFLPIIPSPQWKPVGDEAPLPHILGLLAATIGFPFILLSATTPLLTGWRTQFDATSTSESLVRLYALSNFGSLLALLSYPILVEPAIPTHAQAVIWSWLYAGFVVLGVVQSWRYRGAFGSKAGANSILDLTTPPLIDRALWVLLPMAASALMLAVTNHILRDIAAIPLLWVVPLALYLASFVITFDSPRWYLRAFWLVLFAAFSSLMFYELAGHAVGNLDAMLIFYSVGLFVCCVVCHGELVSLKPAPDHLTTFYLSLSAGGVCGGAFVAVIAPLLFSADIDLEIILPTTVLLVIGVVYLRWPKAPGSLRPLLALAAMLLCWALDTGKMIEKVISNYTGTDFVERNFYGPLKVGRVGSFRLLMNGHILHGSEFLAPDKRGEPTSYYAPRTGLGLALTSMHEARGLHVGVVGLGAGTIAAYGRHGDLYRFYEINPADIYIAETYFHYLALSGAKCEVAVGDARLTLEREGPQNFDFLALDAFTSDSIPVHLLTREAFSLYWRQLKPDGILAVHISNKYVNLAPVVALAAKESGKAARLIRNDGDSHSGQSASEWVLVASNPAFFRNSLLGKAEEIQIPTSLKPWTDNYSNLWQSLR